MKILKLFLLLITVLLLAECTNKFEGINQSNTGSGNIGDTLYVQQNPVWTGFNKPQDIIVGKEPFLYVADTENNRIVMMDVAGQVLGSKIIQRPVALAQDHQLNLIVCGEMVDTNGTTYSAVFKINLFAANHIIADAPVDTLLPKTSFDFLRVDRKYTGVCIFSDNSFYIARTGPANSNLIDPDNAILVFQKKVQNDGTKTDTLTRKLPALQPTGTGIPSINVLSSLTSFNSNSTDFIMSIIGQNSFRVQWLQYVVRPDFEGYQNVLPASESSLMKINKFGKPEGVTIDNRSNIFVADAEKDSVFKFNRFGEELESFGGSTIYGLDSLNAPHAIAYFDKTLYVVDTNNDRILRFILSTDIQ